MSALCSVLGHVRGGSVAELTSDIELEYIIFLNDAIDQLLAPAIQYQQLPLPSHQSSILLLGVQTRFALLLGLWPGLFQVLLRVEYQHMIQELNWWRFSYSSAEYRSPMPSCQCKRCPNILSICIPTMGHGNFTGSPGDLRGLRHWRHYLVVAFASN